MDPAKWDIVINQGKTFRKTFYSSQNGAAWPTGTLTWSAQLRDYQQSTKLADFTVTATTETASDLTTKLKVVITLSATTTAALTAGSAKWGIEALRSSDGEVFGFFEGDALIKKESPK